MSSTPTTSSASLLNHRRRIRSGFAGSSGGVAAKPFDFSSLGSTSIASSFNPDLVRNYRGVLGQETTTSRQVTLGYSREDDEEEEDRDAAENNNNYEGEEEVNPDDEVQIVIKPAKSYLNHREQDDDDEEEDPAEENDILTELNVQRKEQLRGKRSVNGRGAAEKDQGQESGSESAGSHDSSSLVHVDLLSKRRKLGLSRMTPSTAAAAGAKNGTSSMGSSINFSSHLQSDKSLFSDKNILASAGPSSMNASTTSLNSLAPKRSFNAGLYGSMSALSDSRLLNIKSPYYNGPTMFGGASAYSQKPLYAGIRGSGGANKLFRSNTGLPMMRPSSSLSSLSMLGSRGSASASGLERSTTGLGAIGGGSPKGTAKRVLDLINQLNSPLEEIRKMASGSLLNESASSSKKLPSLVGQRSRFSSDPNSMSGIRLNSPKTPYSRVGERQQQQQQRSPLTTELQVPSMPQLLQMNKLQRSTEEIRRLAFQSRSGLSQETEYKLPGREEATEGKSKMKVKLNRMATRGGSTKVDEERERDEEAVEVPKFPEIKFPEMKEMPRIDIRLPAVEKENPEEEEKKRVWSSNGGFASSSGSSSIFNAQKSTAGESATSNNIFGGAKTTTTVTRDSPEPRSDDVFQFAAPIALKADGTSSAILSPLKMNFVFSEPTKAGDKGAAGTTTAKATAEKSESPAKSVFGAFKFNPATAKVKEGFTAAAATEKKEEAELMGTMTAKELKKGSVEEALGLTPKINSAPFTASSFGDKFKPPSDTWSCSVCMVRNKEADLKCVACATPKEPEKKKADGKPVETGTPLPTPPKDDGFKALIAAQKADKWECGDCMLKNDQSAMKCICCESPKPGAGASAAKKAEPAKINSANPFAPAGGSGGFAFGFKGPAAAAAASTAAVKTDESFGKLVSSQQAKWECSTCMTRNEQTRSKCACCEQSKPGSETEKVPQFSFGAVSNSNKFSFGMPPSSSVAEEKKTEAPLTTAAAGGFKFGMSSKPVETTAAAPSFAFGMPSSTKVDAGKPEGEKKEAEEKPAAPASLGGFKFGVTSQSAADSIPATVDSKTPAKEITPVGGFKFGMSSAETVTPAPAAFSFGAAKPVAKSSENEQKKDEEKKVPAPTFAFGSAVVGGATKDVPVFGAAATTATGDASKKVEPAQPLFGGMSTMTPLFGAVPAKDVASPLAKELPKSSVGFGAAAASPTFSFGASTAAAGATTSESNQPLFGSTSSATNSLSAIKPIAFGAPAVTETKTSEPPKATFAFGSALASTPAKPDETKVFGSTSQAPQGTSSFAFGATPTISSGSSFGLSSAPSTDAAKSPAPLFGGMSSGTPAFGAAAATVPSFGRASPFGATTAASKPAESTPSLFGNATGSNTSTFGSTAAAQPGIFGSPANNVPAFGSSAPVTGNSSFDVKDGHSAATPFQFGGAPASNNVSGSALDGW